MRFLFSGMYWWAHHFQDQICSVQQLDLQPNRLLIWVGAPAGMQHLEAHSLSKQGFGLFVQATQEQHNFFLGRQHVLSITPDVQEYDSAWATICCSLLLSRAIKV